MSRPVGSPANSEPLPTQVEKHIVSNRDTDGPSALEPKPKKPRPPPKVPNADRPPGKSLLPAARVQRIMKADKELPSCSKEATFLISVATEEFIKRLGQAGQQQATKAKRSTVQRKDVVAAVRKTDEFVFLEEILSQNAPTPPQAPIKRRTKQSATTNNDTNASIKDVFTKGGGKRGNSEAFLVGAGSKDLQQISESQQHSSSQKDKNESSENVNDLMDVA